MNRPTKNDRLIRFSVFELDRDSRELFKQGRKVKLQGQPFELLLALLERPGEILTRDELRQRIWPSDTAGDFDHGLNRAVNKVREALGDSAETPRFIETIPRRGYRFIGEIQQPDRVSEDSAIRMVGEALRSAAAWTQAPPVPLTAHAVKSHPRLWLAGAGSLLLFLAALLLVFEHFRPQTPTGELRIQQLTTNSSENPVWSAVISPDGKYLAYGDLSGIQILVIGTGESHLLPRPPALTDADAWFPAAWLPDGTSLLTTSMTAKVVTAWKISVISGKATPLRTGAHVQSVSPDGSLVAFTSGRQLTGQWTVVNRDLVFDSEIWVMSANGENARNVIPAAAGTYFGSVRWSPDGLRLAYQKLSSAGGIFWDYSIESRRLDQGAPEVAISDPHTAGFSVDVNFPQDFWWLPGRIVYSVPEKPPNSRETNIWQVAVDNGTGTPLGRPRRITNLAGFHMQSFSAGANGHRLVAVSGSARSHVLIASLKADGDLENPRRLTTDQRYNYPLDWTRDSKAVIFISDRTGNFSAYKQALDQNVPELITSATESVRVARVSPDGASLLYTSTSLSKPSEVVLKRVPLSGGVPQFLFKTPGLDFACPRLAGAQCVGSELSFETGQRLIAFDPATGARRELFRFGAKPMPGIVSPDGTRFVFIDAGEGIEIRTLAGQIQKRIDLKEWAQPTSVDWAADGKALFISHVGLIESPSGPVGATLLRVELDGRVKPLWDTKAGRSTWAVASPNSKYLAIREPATERNAWMIENF